MPVRPGPAAPAKRGPYRRLRRDHAYAVARTEKTLGDEYTAAQRKLEFSSSVHTHETNPQRLPGIILEGYAKPDVEFSVPPIEVCEAAFRHSGWRYQRLKVFRCMQRLHVNCSRLDRFANCGSGCRVIWSPSTEQARLLASYCHDRFCVPCARARSVLLAANAFAHCKGKLMRFLTLTLRHSKTPLRAQIKRLFKSFAELRRWAFWKENVAGGVYFLEVKWIERTRMWHPHLHVLLQTNWLPQKDIAEAWHGITGDSFIVDIRPIEDQQKGAAYVAKYAAKGFDGSVLSDPDALAEAISALRGTRVFSTFGDWRTIKLDAVPDGPDDWVAIGTLARLWEDFRAGNPLAKRILWIVLAADPAEVCQPPPPTPPFQESE